MVIKQFVQAFPNAKQATEEDWATEYLALKLSVKIVSDVRKLLNISISMALSILKPLLQLMKRMRIYS